MARRERMNEDTLAALVDGQITDARQFATSDLVTSRDKALEYVRGEISDIPAELGKSSVTSRDLSDVLNWIMPGLLRVFLASDRVAVYEPNKQEMGQDEQGKPIDVAAERAAQATDYLNYVFLAECGGYRVLQSAFYDGLLLGNGIIKHWWDPTTEYKTESFTGLSDDQYTYLVAHPDVEEVLEHSERGDVEGLGGSMGQRGEAAVSQGIAPSMAGLQGAASGMPEAGMEAPAVDGSGVAGLPAERQVPLPIVQPQVLHDCKIKRKVTTGRLRIEALPPEEFLIERNAKALDETIRFCAHYYQATRSDLVEMGYDRARVEDMPAGSSTTAFDTANLSREGTGLGQSTIDGPDKSTELVDVYECYVLCDYDGDGIAERRRIVMAGGIGRLHLVENEEWDDDLPFSDLVPEPVPHRWKGRSLYDETADVMRIKTALIRQTQDNLYQTNNPMNEVLENSVVNMEALINRQLGGNVFVKQKGSVTPLEVPFTAKESFAMLEYWDQVLEKRTGVSRSTMALDMDALANQTATATNAATAAAATKNETYARNMAETGMKRMFRCILKLITKHQDKPRTIRLRGKWVEIDPTAWDPDMDVTINTGLGSGSRDRDLAMLQGVAAKQELILTTVGPNNPIVTFKEYRDTLAKMAEAAGLRSPEQYFKDVTDEALQQHAQSQQAAPDPKMLELQAKTQAEAQKMQMTAQIEQAKLQMAAQQSEREAQQKYQLELAKAQQEAELQHVQAQRQAEIEVRQAEADMAVEQQKVQAAIALEQAKFEFERELRIMDMQAKLQERQQAAQDAAQREAAQPQPEPQQADSGLSQGLQAIAQAMTQPKTIVHERPNGGG